MAYPSTLLLLHQPYLLERIFSVGSLLDCTAGLTQDEATKIVMFEPALRKENFWVLLIEEDQNY